MDTRLIFLNTSAVIGATYVAHAATKWGIEKLKVTNETAKNWTINIVTISTGIFSIYTVSKQYRKMAINEKTILELKGQVNSLNQLLISQIQNPLFKVSETLNVVKQKCNLTPIFEAMVAKVGQSRFQEILKEVGVLDYNKITDAYFLNDNYANIPVLKKVVEKFGLVMLAVPC